MRFIDEVKIFAQAGHGGAGSAHFRREKYVPLGGPDGGDGGNGGSIVLVADNGKNTLLDFQFKKEWYAKNGEPGSKGRKNGKSTEDLIIKVPVGTQIFSKDQKTLICDLDAHGSKHILVKGGKGGKGNVFFKSSTNRAPTYCQPGRPGEEDHFFLSLKLIADVGLVGLPNAGKSTFISSVSAAKPKVANYPFTTLEANLGMVKTKSGFGFVIADIPGLVPDAHKGKGLGHKFLKHVARTKILLHLVDPFALNEQGEKQDPVTTYNLIDKELEAFSDEFSRKKKVVAFTKSDSFDEDILKDIKQASKHFEKQGIRVFTISSINKDGIPNLVDYLEKECRLNDS